MKVKLSGNYYDTTAYVKRGGVYVAPDVFVKASGEYVAETVTQRLTIVGSTVYDYDGVTPIVLRGPNFGAYGRDLESDADLYLSWGANFVRFVAPRWWGLYGGFAGTDSRDNNSPQTAYINATNLAYVNTILGTLKAAGLKTQLAFETDCGSNGNQPGEAEYCRAAIGLSGDTPAVNFWTNPEQLAIFIDGWKYLLGNLTTQPDIIECMPEPANADGAAVKALYEQIMDGCLEVQPQAIFAIGSTNYGTGSMDEVVFTDRTNIIYMANLLSSALINLATLPGKVADMVAVRDTYNVPIQCDQLGARTGDDPSLYFFNAGHSLCTANGIHFATWQSRQNTADVNEYAFFYDPNNWTLKTAQRDRFIVYTGQTYATVRAAAVAAATAASATLYFVEADLSNIRQDSAGTTPVTADGQPIGLVNPVVGSVTLLQATAGARPTLTTIAATGRKAILFDAVNTYLSGSAAFFSSGSQFTAIGAGVPADVASAQDFVYAGGSSGTAKWPRLSASAGKVATLFVQTDTTNITVTGTTSTAGTPVVLSCTRDGSNNKILYSMGVQDGATDSTVDGAIASFTRLRVGGSTTNNPTFNGPIALVCIATSVLSGANRQAIERFGAFLAGSYYQN